MSDFILIDGDQAIFNPAFGLATVMVKPGDLKASGESSLQGKKVCLRKQQLLHILMNNCI